VGVVVGVFQSGLVGVPMSVLGPVVVGVAVLMCDVVVLVRRVCMSMCHFAMLVFVRVWRFMVVLLGHRCSLFMRNFLLLMAVDPAPSIRRPPSVHRGCGDDAELRGRRALR
jgi:hypothetical protein